MTEQRIKLKSVSIRFRMSYHKVKSTSEMLVEWGRRISHKWQPDYFTALNNINLTVGTGEIIGIIGRNGSGKSTLLRTISGIYEPDFGSVHVSGRISALLQLGTGFNTMLSGRENIILGGLTLGNSRSEIDAQMDLIIDFAELGEFIDIPMRYYSSGMMSRLSFALIISLEPDIILIDETLSVGDIGFQKKAKAEMKRLLEKASCQLIVSHDLATIERICTRAILLEEGKIYVDDEPKIVIKEYEKMFEREEKNKSITDRLNQIAPVST